MAIALPVPLLLKTSLGPKYENNTELHKFGNLSIAVFRELT